MSEGAGRGDGRTRRFASTVVTTGLVVVALGFLAVAVVDPGSLMIVGVPAAVLLGIAAAVRWGPRWVGYAALLVGVIGLLGGVSGIGFGWHLLESFGDFVPPLLHAAGAVLTVIGAVGVVAERRWGTRRHRLALRALLSLLTLAVVASAVATVTSPTEVPPGQRRGAVPVDMSDTAFRPDRLTAEAGMQVKVLLVNDDRSTHTFTIDELEVDEIVSGGRERLVTVIVDDPGSYRYRCRVGGHDAQRGTLEVTT